MIGVAKQQFGLFHLLEHCDSIVSTTASSNCTSALATNSDTSCFDTILAKTNTKICEMNFYHIELINPTFGYEITVFICARS